ncbi:MAG: hypothetical protein AVDCRST_MAG73-1149 [uncultured Thermomicrobiales bacterium]|uniref:Uncharacterized protein n=1 Tax=uncultured Thermomicrobiales bacterium TaxID=1645740 RepID=A0A6J4TV65_9BACT|nr:MAG: hypothetical protein AVDCRST_MAG73-1149 [uncultured Thermomicrobiales bacterium]
MRLLTSFGMTLHAVGALGFARPAATRRSLLVPVTSEPSLRSASSA